MKYVISALLLFQGLPSKMLFDFNTQSNLNNWVIVDDVVMGGRSSGQLRLSPYGNGVFEGKISLDNNGGFSSVRYQFEKTQVNKNSKIKIRLKGDGKDYQFRVKHNSRSYYSYITTFSTTNEWQDIELTLKDMYPSFRGRVLNQPNFAHEVIEQIVFLIANKKNEKFSLQIDSIELI